MTCDRFHDTLHAYADDELTGAECVALETHLAGCTACATELASIRALSRRTKEQLVRYEAPDVLKARIRAEVAKSGAVAPESRHRRAWWTGIAAAMLIVASSGITLVAVNAHNSASTLEAELLASHIRSLQPGHLADVVSSNQHNVKPWFNGRADVSPSVPDLSANGFTLVGGRLDYVGNHTVSAIVYARRLHFINVYTLPTDRRDVPVMHRSINGYHLVHWAQNGLEHWAVSDLNDEELGAFVRDYSAAAGT